VFFDPSLDRAAGGSAREPARFADDACKRIRQWQQILASTHGVIRPRRCSVLFDERNTLSIMSRDPPQKPNLFRQAALGRREVCFVPSQCASSGPRMALKSSEPQTPPIVWDCFPLWPGSDILSVW
jgi:hypothetical protein